MALVVIFILITLLGLVAAVAAGLISLLKRNTWYFFAALCFLLYIVHDIIPTNATRWQLTCFIFLGASVLTGKLARTHNNTGLIKVTGILALAFVACGVYTLAKSDFKPFGKSIKSFTEEEGEDIYNRLLGMPLCKVTILAAKAAYIPIIDADESIHFTTCPAEVRRILNKDSGYQVTIQSKTSFDSWIPGDKVFFSPDTTIVSLFLQDIESNSSKTIYLSRDSTEMYYGEAW